MKKTLCVLLLSCIAASFSMLLGIKDIEQDLGAWNYPVKPWENPPRSFRVGIVKEGGASALRVDATEVAWEHNLTRIFGLPEGTRRVLLTAKMKIENVVPGPESYTKARVILEFMDEAGRFVGDWSATTDVHGTRDWFDVRHDKTPPPAAAMVRVHLGLFGCTGTVWYREVHFSAFGANGQELPVLVPPKEEKTDTARWWTFEPGTEDTSRPLVFDASGWLQGPAGSRGFLKMQDGELFFTDGTPARFWGINIGSTAAWPRKEDAVVLAERLARAGVNLVRFHHLDAGWASEDLFEKGQNHTQSFDADRLDRLDFLYAELTKRGIHVMFDLLVTRKFRSGDNVRDFQQLEYGAKIAAHFNPRLIELQKDYARLLMAHRNPYTGKTYAEDPALAFVGIINESNIFMVGGIADWFKLPRSYVDEINTLFDAWCAKNGVERPQGDVPELIKKRNQPVHRFLMQVQNAHFDTLRDFLKKDLGYKGMVGGSNYTEVVADVFSNARMDFYDTHSYWDHPQGGWQPTGTFHNLPLVKSMFNRNMLNEVGIRRLFRRPLMISEWDATWPNEWIAEGSLIMSAWGQFQGWEAPIQFHIDRGAWGHKMEGCWDISNKPHAWFSFALGGLMFLRGDVEPGPLLLLPYWSTDLTARVDRSGIRNDLFLTHRVAQTQRADLAEKLSVPMPPPADPTQPVFAEGRQLAVLPEGMVLVDTPRTQGLVGFAQDREMALSQVTVRLRTPFAQVVVTSLDEKPIAETGRLLLTAIARAENTGQTYRPFRKGLREEGRGPVLLEPVVTQIHLRQHGFAEAQGLPVCHALDWYGRRTEQTVPVRREQDGSLLITLDGKVPAYAFELRSAVSEK